MAAAYMNSARWERKEHWTANICEGRSQDQQRAQEQVLLRSQVLNVLRVPQTNISNFSGGFGLLLCGWIQQT
jgi:hypothetical protein